MLDLRAAIKSLQKRLAHPQIPAGLFHFERAERESRVRFHLRIDPDGNGTLIKNANQVFHLNPAAALLAYYYLHEVPDYEAVGILKRTFSISQYQAENDYAQFQADLAILLDPHDACPICDIDLDVKTPFSTRPTAPYRMDLALTYRCNNDCAHCYNISNRQDPELTTEQWKNILTQLWQVGIPHIVFTGGEPTLRQDLPELIAHAESLGQITGLNTNGRRLQDPAFVEKLVAAGLDHVQITLESHDPQVHDQMVLCPGAWKQTTRGIQNALKSRLFVMTNTTLLQNNVHGLADTLDFLAALGVPTVGLNALIYSGRGAQVGTGLPEAALPALLDLARHKTETAGQRLIWYTPTQYCNFDPVQMELGVKGCTAALYNMCIEPDGAVLPCQSYYRSTGNILTDSWDSIWEHDLCVWLRERQYVPEKCTDCLILQECGGGCPLQLEIGLENQHFVPLAQVSTVQSPR
jgi:radical SAM protein with 4Fe4S-binding SPASM domain